MENKKKTGAYYTPPILSDFIIKHISENFLSSNFGKSDNIEILEPSAGDGVFFRSIDENKDLKKKNYSITAVEINQDEIANLKSALKTHKNSKVINSDFLDFTFQSSKKFDVIVGNPPYIKRNHLSKKQVNLCLKIHKEGGLNSKSTIKNIWTAFLVGSILKLKEKGVLAFVLPAELLQVKYTQEIRDSLKEFFNEIEIFTFKDLIFDNIEQDVITIIGYKYGTSVPLKTSFYHVEKLSDLTIPEYTKRNNNTHRKTLEKWTNYLLTEEELNTLNDLKNRFKPLSYYSTSRTGIVTGANNYFIIGNETIKKYKLQKYCNNIVQKSSYIPNVLNLSASDIQQISDKGKPYQLLNLNQIQSSKFNKKLLEYLSFGEEQKINVRYKCSLRERWFDVPLVKPSDALFIKRTNFYPKILLNEEKIMTTDSFYYINMLSDFKAKNLVYSFYNTLTFIFAELEGRYYGGGVLELTPNEFKNLSVPYLTKVSNNNFKQLSSLIEKNKIQEILNFTDEVILKESGLRSKEIKFLRNIYSKLVDRRLKI